MTKAGTADFIIGRSSRDSWDDEEFATQPSKREEYYDDGRGD